MTNRSARTRVAACAAIVGCALATSAGTAVAASDTVKLPAPSYGRPTVAFGTHDVAAAPIVKRITVINTGDDALSLPTPVVEPLRVVPGGGADPFALVGETCSATLLAPDETCAVDVRLTPSASDRPAGRGPNEISQLIIRPVGKPVSTTRLDAWILHPSKLNPMVKLPLRLGSVRLGRTSAPKTITLFSWGNYDILGGQVTLTGADADQFSIGADRCSGILLKPYSRCTYDVEFAPTSAGVKLASMAIVGAGGDPAGSTMAVRGTGLPSVATTLRALARRAGHRIGGPRLRTRLARPRFSLGSHAWPAAGQVAAEIELAMADGGRRVLARGGPTEVTGTGRESIGVRVLPGALDALQSLGRVRQALVRFRLSESDGRKAVGVRRLRVSATRPAQR